jgi:hypothetical protein
VSTLHITGARNPYSALILATWSVILTRFFAVPAATLTILAHSPNTDHRQPLSVGHALTPDTRTQPTRSDSLQRCEGYCSAILDILVETPASAGEL